MTEQEAIDRLKCLRLYMKITDKTSENKFLEEDYIANNMAIKALEEIRQYRALGTVDELRDSISQQQDYKTDAQGVTQQSK